MADFDRIILNEIEWNCKAIADFINRTPSIEYVLLTQKSNTIFLQKYIEIKNLCNRNLSFRCIHTPSGQSVSGVPKELFLALQWLIEQNANPFSYGFDINWLHQHNVHSFTHNGYTLNF